MVEQAVPQKEAETTVGSEVQGLGWFLLLFAVVTTLGLWWWEALTGRDVLFLLGHFFFQWLNGLSLGVVVARYRDGKRSWGALVGAILLVVVASIPLQAGNLWLFTLYRAMPQTLAGMAQAVLPLLPFMSGGHLGRVLFHHRRWTHQRALEAQIPPNATRQRE